MAAGTALDAAYGPYQGKQTGETALFRTLHGQLDEGDILLADRGFCSYFAIALLQQRGVDVVFRLHQGRPADFRHGQRLGAGDRLVTWSKPDRLDWLDEATYQQLPDCLTLRLLRIHVPKEITNVRSRQIDLVTTLVDAQWLEAIRVVCYTGGLTICSCALRSRYANASPRSSLSAKLPFVDRHKTNQRSPPVERLREQPPD